ncbi:putative acyl-CoA synthetase [Ixodes scapularis]
MQGTTGQPKAARLSHFNVINNANIVGRFVGYHQKRESICLNTDLIYGLGRTMGVLAASMFGSTIVTAGAYFLPKVALEVITKHRCTMIYGSPTIFFAMARDFEEGVHDFSSVRKGKQKRQLPAPCVPVEMVTWSATGVFLVAGAISNVSTASDHLNSTLDS